MAGCIDKRENIAVVVPVSPQEFAAFCRTAMRELTPTRGVRPSGVPLSNEDTGRICRDMEINQRNLEEVLDGGEQVLRRT